MSKTKLHEFYDAVNDAIAAVGRNATKIADRVIKEAFPNTLQAAEREGSDKMLREGVIAKVKAILTKGGGASVYQGDFSDIHPDFKAAVNKLHSHSHYVPILDQYVHISVLIEHPEWLDAARRFKRQKGEETLAEAAALDELYAAVMRFRRKASSRQ